MESIDESIVNKKINEKLVVTCLCVEVLDLMAKSGHNMRNEILGRVRKMAQTYTNKKVVTEKMAWCYIY